MNPRRCPLCHGTGFVETDDKIGQDMRAAREKAGFSGRETAKRMGISAPYLSDLELGRRHWSHELLTRFKVAIKNPQL